MIHLNGVKKTYFSGGQAVVALAADIAINRGEFVVVTGRSGSGKSTMLNLLAGIDRPSEGRVIIGGQDISGYSEAGLAKWRGRAIGIVFQFFQLIPNLSVLENILLPMELVSDKKAGINRERAMQLLEKVGMSGHRDKMPGELSGGEQQRVAIARSLANEAPLLLADEPTGNLDSENAGIVLELLRQLAREGMTIVMVTHEREPVEGATRQLILRDGRVIGDSKEMRGAINEKTD